MITATADERGTVQGLAKELDEAVADGKHCSSLQFNYLYRYTTQLEGLPFYPSPRPQYSLLQFDVYNAILAELRKQMPHLRSHLDVLATNQAIGSQPLSPWGHFHDFVVVDGRRYNAASRSSTTKNSLLRTQTNGYSEVCKLVDIIRIEGNGMNEMLLVTQVFSELMAVEETAWDSM